MKETATDITMWQLDCKEFAKSGEEFCVKKVTTDADRIFCTSFELSKYEMRWERDTAIFTPRISN